MVTQIRHVGSCHVRRRQCLHLGIRCFGLVPGPLEAQRRLGKRKMAELQSSPPVLPSILGIFDVVDMTKWKWWPPNSLLEDGNARKPRKPGLITRWINEIIEEGEEPLDLEPKRPEPEALLLSTVDHLVAIAQEKPSMEWETMLGDTCKLFESQLARGQVSPEVTIEVFYRLWDTVWPQFSRRDHLKNAKDLLIMLCSSIMHGSLACTIQGPEAFPSDFWSCLLQRLLGLAYTQHIKTMLAGVLERLSPEQIRHMFTGSRSLLMMILPLRDIFIRQDIPFAQTHVSYWQTKTAATMMQLEKTLKTERNERHYHVARAALSAIIYTHRFLAPFVKTDYSLIESVSGCLKHAAKWAESDFVRKLSHHVTVNTFLDAPSDRHTRYQWALLLAHLPQIGPRLLFPIIQSLFTFEGFQKRTLTINELSRLLLVHWSAHGCLEKQEIIWAKYEEDPRAFTTWSGLSSLLYYTQSPANRMLQYRAIYRMLKYMGHRFGLIKPFMHVRDKRWADTILAWLEVIPDPNMSGLLRSVALLLVEEEDFYPLWNRKINGRTMKGDIICNFQHILGVLRVPHNKAKEQMKRKKRKLRPRVAKTLEQTILALAKAPGKINRQAFRAASRVLRHLLAHRHPIPLDVWGSLFHLATGHIMSPVPGRRTSGPKYRVNWVCRLVATHVNEESAMMLVSGYQKARKRLIYLLHERREARRQRY